MIRDQLLTEIDAFLARHRMTDYAFGKKAADDGHLIRRLRHGLDPRVSTIEKLKAYMVEADKALQRDTAA